MAITPHIERHFTATESVRDVVIGMADGLTVPFALAAGLSGLAAISAAVVVTAGLAEIAAGAIAMGLGGYLAAKTDREHYASERAREYQETLTMPEREREEVAYFLKGYGLSEAAVTPLLNELEKDRDKWVDFMMKFELGLEEPDPNRAKKSAMTIGASYVLGGLIPLAPYIMMRDVPTALWTSVGVTLFALGIFGYVKARFTGISRIKGAAQTMLIGGAAAAAAFAMAKLFSHG
jgi:VIT1/CCC1 family predicted Fe2+/Mn2+ transporter